MTKLESLRKEYGPTPWGIVRFLGALLSLLGVIYMEVWQLQKPLWNAGSQNQLTATGTVAVYIGVTASILAWVIIGFTAAWAFLGFQNPFDFISRVYRINWKSHNCAHCWMEKGTLRWRVVDTWEGFTPPTGVLYSLVIPLARGWGNPLIYDWVHMSPLGSIAPLSARVARDYIEMGNGRRDHVWLQDRHGDIILAPFEEALTSWIPRAISEGGKSASLAVAAGSLNSRVGYLENRFDEKSVLIGQLDEEIGSALSAMFTAIRDYHQTRRFRFSKEGIPIFAELSRSFEVIGNVRLIRMAKVESEKIVSP